MSKIILQRGNPYTSTIQFHNTTLSASYDITNYTASFCLKRNIDVGKDDSYALIHQDIISHSAPLSGSTVLSLLGSQTDIASDSYIYDFKLTSGSFSINTTSGTCEIVDVVTKTILGQ